MVSSLHLGKQSMSLLVAALGLISIECTCYRHVVPLALLRAKPFIPAVRIAIRQQLQASGILPIDLSESGTTALSTGSDTMLPLPTETEQATNLEAIWHDREIYQLERDLEVEMNMRVGANCWALFP